jgi:hypothetical protein
VPNKKRYLLIFNFCFDSLILTQLLLSLRERGVNEDAPFKTVPSTNTEKAVDVEVTRIAKEK